MRRSDEPDDDPLPAWLAALTDDDAGQPASQAPADQGVMSSAPPEPPGAAQPPADQGVVPPAPPGAGPTAADAPVAPPPPGLDDEPDRPRRRWRLWALAAVPWVVGAALAATTLGDRSTPTDGAPAASGAAAPTAPADPPEGPAAPPPTRPAAAGPLDPRLAAAAEQAVHLEVPRALDDAGAAGRYVEQARALAAHRAGEDAVVTVAALVRVEDGDRWGPPLPARFAVSLSADGAVLREPPWPLPADGMELSAEPAALEPVTETDVDFADAADRALDGAGYRDVSVAALHRIDDAALRVELRGIPPGEDAARDLAVWVDPQRAAVLGEPAATDADPEPDR